MLQKSNPAILIVDRHQHSADVIRDRLREIGLRNLHRANNSDRALKLLRETLYSLVIVDTEIGPLSGLRLLQAMRQSPKTTAARYIVLSGSADATALSRFWKKHGADGVLRKPYSLTILKRTVTRVLSADSALHSAKQRT